MPDASGSEPRRQRPRNVFGEPLAECCTRPMTGFYRTGSCDTGPEDFGVHTVCAHVDAEFLAFSKAAGNDLSTPFPAAGFPGSSRAIAGACARRGGRRRSMPGRHRRFGSPARMKRRSISCRSSC